MKAYWVFIPDEWGEVVHATTRNQAKVKIMHEYGVDEYISLRAVRVKELDDKQLNFDNTTAKFHYIDEDGEPLKEIDFYNPCKCEICKNGESNATSTD